MFLDTVIENAAAILGTVPNVGNVYDYRRWAADEATFRSLFIFQGKILAWTISWESTSPVDESDQGAKDFHAIVFRGWMGTQDAKATEKDFRNLVQTVRNTFGLNRGLNVQGVPALGCYSHRMAARRVDYAKYGEYLCHYCELVLTVEEIVEPG